MGEFLKADTGLPKNIRQVGERENEVRLYVEDYVNIYLKRMTPASGQRIRAGLLLGRREETDGFCMLIDGALEMCGITDSRGQVEFTEAAWKQAYREIEDHFPGRDVQGWFLCGDRESAMNPSPYQKAHSRYFTEKNQVLFLNNGPEGEEAWYVADREGFYKLRGFSIYYERNQMMQDYLVSLRDNRVEAGGSDPVIRDFRRKMQERKKEAEKQGKNGQQTLKALCGVCFVAALAGCVVSFRSLEKMKVMETAVMSVVPEWKSEKDILAVGRAILDARKGLGELQESGKRETGDSYGEEHTALESHVLLEAPGSDFPTVSGTTEELPALETLPEAQTGSTENTVQSDSDHTENADTLAEGETAAEPATEPEQEVLRVLEPAPGQSVYLVREGQTLYGICFELYQNLSRVDEICRLNGITDVNKLEAGRRLIVP